MSDYNNQKVVVRTPSFPLLGVLFIVFLILKLTGAIGWSWWAVTAPLWGPLALILAVAFLAAIVALIAHSIRKN